MAHRCRSLLVALVVALGCGAPESPSEPRDGVVLPERPIAPADPGDPGLAPIPAPNPPEIVLATWPWWGYEYLGALSYRPSDPESAVRAVRKAGGSHLRTLTQLARWGSQDAPDGWFVDALEHRDEWVARRNALVDAGERHGVRIEISLFDEPRRWDRPEVIAALEREGLVPELAGTWLGREISDQSAIELAAWWLEGLDPGSPALIVRTSNEPQDIPGMPEQVVEDWLERQGFTVARTTRFGVDGPYGSPDYLWEHAWGEPDVVQPWPPLSRLAMLRAAVRPVLGAEAAPIRVGLSTDGFGAEDFPEAAKVGCDVLRRGFGYSILLRRAPDLALPIVDCLP